MINESQILVCVGSGGVGKTTVAASLGVLAAKMGKQVLVLTIDPSRRLASILGIEGTEEITRVPGQNYQGQLFASVINHKKIFDEFVTKAAEKSHTVEKILKNKLYIQLSTSMSGSQEFTSLQKLYSCYESKKYDLIILDTPPTQHAIDFLNSPQKLANLFNENISKWFRQPHEQGLLSQLFAAGTKQVVRVLETLTGTDFIAQLADFFTHIKDWQSQLQKRIIDVHRLLVSPNTRFCVIAGSDEAKTKEAEFLLKELYKSGHHVSAVIFNRVFPDWIELNDEMDPELFKSYSQMKEYYKQKSVISQNFQDKIGGMIEVFRIPDVQGAISDLQGLENICDFLVNSNKKG